MRQVALVVACLALGAVAMPEPPVPSGQYGAPGNQGGYPSANSNSVYGGESDSDYEDANYEFNYDVEEQESGLKFGHEEARQGDMAQGRYYVLLPDGRTQTVEYTADQDGYHPKISYQDPRDQGYGGGASGGQGGYSNAGGASGGRNGYSDGGSSNGGGAAGGQTGYSTGSGASGGRNGYSNSGGAPGGSNGYSSGQSGYSSDNGGYPGSSGPGASAGYSR